MRISRVLKMGGWKERWLKMGGGGVREVKGVGCGKVNDYGKLMNS